MIPLKSKTNYIKQILKTEYFPVGIQIIQDTQIHLDTTFKEINLKKRFCYYVRLAAKGQKFLIKAHDQSECFTPYICLGFEEPDYTDFSPRITPSRTRAIAIAPLHHFDTPVDSIVFIVNARQAMVLIGALRRILKRNIEVNLGASMAVCGEVVARTVVDKTPSLSMLCHGARIFSGYADSELVLGIPSHLLEDLYSTLKNAEKMNQFELYIREKEVNLCSD